MSSRSSSHASSNRHDDPLLPFDKEALKHKFGYPFEKAPALKLRARSMLSRGFVKRILIWTVASLALASVILYSTRRVSHHHITTHNSGQSESTGGGDKSEATGEAHNADQADGPSDGDESESDDVSNDHNDDPEDGSEDSDRAVASVPGVDEEEDEEDEIVTNLEEIDAKKQSQDEAKRMPWLRFKHLDAYFHGLKMVVPKEQHIAEYPNPAVPDAPLPAPPLSNSVPKPRPYNPHDPPDPERVVTCYLDANETIPTPDIFAYDGMPQNFPEPVLGSYEVMGMRDDVCFDRFGRYGPYGLGYAKNKGGSGVGMDTESSNSDYVWAETGQIDYSEIDWSDAQDRCYDANKRRFRQVEPETQELEESESKMGRIAVVIRAYTGFRWTEHAILNFRALISELSLKTGGEYQVHLLLHVRDTDVPIWSDEVTVQRLLDANVPPEFHGITTLWSEPQMRLFYPGKFGATYSNPSGRDIHGVYRSGHFPLQVFAMQHPEYEHFWNWEMDMRFLGSYYELFHRAGKWAEAQARPMIWERSARYYIPSHHGTWDEFAKKTQVDTLKSGLSTPFGPLRFSGRKALRFEAKGESIMPKDCGAHADRSRCGVGEPADIITLNPIFDTDQSGWFFGLDATGYAETPPPRRAAIITASRLSRRLLMAMHEETWRHHHTMFSEMFPPTVAFHHGFKAAFAPHPIYLDRAWLPFGAAADAAFNGGRDHSTSGHGSPFDIANEHNHRGSTWYFNSQFSGQLWRRWLGYAQPIPQGKYGQRFGEAERGGKEEEEDEMSSGRLCLRSMLMHPIKWEHPSDPR